MAEISFIVYGTPVAQARTKNHVVNGFVVKFDPKKSADYKNYVRQEALKVKPEIPIEDAVVLTVIAHMPIPGSMSKKKRALAIIGEIRPTKKPDVKNIFTGVEDALKGIIWRDDSLVVRAVMEKWYSEIPRVEVIVKEL